MKTDDVSSHNRSVNTLSMTFFFLIAVLIVGFFLGNTQFIGISRDYANYVAIFSGLDQTVFLELLYRILLEITTDYTVVIFTVLLLSLLLKCIFYAKYSSNTQCLVIFLLYYLLVSTWVLDYTQFRNGLCISVLIYSMLFLFEKRVKAYYISVLLAIATHWSALPFLFLYPYVHHARFRLMGNIIAGGFLFIYVTGLTEQLISYIRTFSIGRKIGNDAAVNVINSLSLSFTAWYLLVRHTIKAPANKYFNNFFYFAILQYIVFAMFSLPVMAFRILEMYFFLMLTIGVFVEQRATNIYLVLGKVVILLYLAFYYHYLFGVID